MFAVTTGPTSYALTGARLSIIGVQLSPHDTYHLGPGNSSVCEPTGNGVPVLPTGAASTDSVTIALPPGTHSFCYNHRTTASAAGFWRLLARVLDVAGAAQWVPATQPKPMQPFLAVFQGHGLSVGNMYNVIRVGAGSQGGASPTPNAGTASPGVPSPTSSPVPGLSCLSLSLSPSLSLSLLLSLFPSLSLSLSLSTVERAPGHFPSPPFGSSASLQGQPELLYDFALNLPRVQQVARDQGSRPTKLRRLAKWQVPPRKRRAPHRRWIPKCSPVHHLFTLGGVASG